MSKGNDWLLSHNLDKLSHLLKSVSDFTKREDQLARDLRVRRYQASQAHQETATRIEERLAGQFERIEQATQEATDRTRKIYQRRKDKVERAHLVATRQLPKKIREVKTGWLGDLQMRRYKMERKLAADLAANDAEQAEVGNTLAEQKDLLRRQIKTLQKLVGGYGSLTKALRSELAAANGKVVKPLTVEPEAAVAKLKDRQAELTQQLRALAKIPALKFFLALPLFVVLIIAVVAAILVAYAMGLNTAGLAAGAGIFLVLGGGAFVLHGLAGRQAQPLAEPITAELAAISQEQEACAKAIAERHDSVRERLQKTFDTAVEALDSQKGNAETVEQEFEVKARKKLETQLPRLLKKIQQAEESKLRLIAVERKALEDDARDQEGAKLGRSRSHLDDNEERLIQEEAKKWADLEVGWQQQVTPEWLEVTALEPALAPTFPEWNEATVDSWSPPEVFSPMVKFADLEVDVNRHRHGVQQDSRLTLPGASSVKLPVTLSFPWEGSLLFETKESADGQVAGVLNNIILRLLANTPPGKLSFTIIDPVGLGKNFAGLMHLADYEESLINRRIWTQRDQIEDRLDELSEHIEKVIQMYLRSEYETITEYNEQAGSVAEKYHFLVIADFPVNFSETAAMRLQNIIASGPRCGVYTLIHWDERQGLPDDFVPDELRKKSIVIRQDRESFVLEGFPADSHGKLIFEQPPGAELAASLVHKIGKSSIDSNRVQVPFSQIAPKPEEYWSHETANEMRVAIGRSGAAKLQYLAMGKGTRQHALFAGKTGSGKSTLFHVIITNLALYCSPEEVEFYLIDFKKGVEFKCYASKRLPHARVVAIESDREFALSVLQRVDAELKRRGDIFRTLGVQDIAGYKRAGGKEPMPRSLLLIDEFQEFFVEDDTVAQSASLLFDRIVRQGRAFGIHVLLGSQTLGGAYSLARATIGQMVIRVALQCNEADAYLIMDENNAAPRLLTRPGEGIYNDAAGAIEGNSPFQVVWLSDEERDAYLDQVNDLVVSRHMKVPTPIVFEGNAPAEIRDNDLLRDALEQRPVNRPIAPKIWLGAPNSIKGPTEVTFNRQSGNHLLIVGQRDEAAVSMLGLAMLALAAQHPAADARFILIHSANPGSPDALYLERIANMLPQQVTVSRGQDIPEIMSELSAEMKDRASSDETRSSVYVLVHHLHKFKKLRNEDEFSFSMSDDGGNPGGQFADLITEGSSQGMHIVATVDTFNNVNRALTRKSLGEFETRVVFQMSANDSASLIDSPKASSLGLHRAILHSEQEGNMETFRPYAAPDEAWLSIAEQEFSQRQG